MLSSVLSSAYRCRVDSPDTPRQRRDVCSSNGDNPEAGTGLDGGGCGGTGGVGDVVGLPGGGADDGEGGGWEFVGVVVEGGGIEIEGGAEEDGIVFGGGAGVAWVGGGD